MHGNLCSFFANIKSLYQAKMPFVLIYITIFMMKYGFIVFRLKKATHFRYEILLKYQQIML